jgi:hypothetical protein
MAAVSHFQTPPRSIGNFTGDCARQVATLAHWTTASKKADFLHPGWNSSLDAALELYGYVAILRHVMGPLPFRPLSVNAVWLIWQGGTVPKIAQAVYDDLAFDRLPILADALEEAGCTKAEILDHCRSGGEHVRGCWVVDLLLGKM